MATQAHCLYCFETLSCHLSQQKQPSLPSVEKSYSSYRAATSTNPATGRAYEDESDDAKPTTAQPTSETSSASTSHSGTQASSSSSLSSAPPALGASPMFVTWNTLRANGEKRLRGCIGTFGALEVEEGLRTYALTAALEDSRFPPVATSELPSLSCGVTLLTDFEPAADALDWTVGVHGLRISLVECGRRLGATYLPDVAPEQGWGKEEALNSLLRKAGARATDWRAVDDLKVTRYQGKRVEVGAATWKAWRAWTAGEGNLPN